MLTLEGSARDSAEREIGSIRAVRPIYSILKRRAGWGGITQPYVVEGRNGCCKIVALRPELRFQRNALAAFSRRVSLYEELAGCSGLPRLVYYDDQCMITEWWEGLLLSESAISEHDVDGLARIVSEPYTLMEIVPNPSPPAKIIAQARKLQTEGLIPAGTEARIEQFLSRVSAPDCVRQGACFGDVSLKNFVRRPSQKIGYIDTMGVDAVEMPINIEKILNALGPGWESAFLARLSVHAPSLAGISDYRPYFRVVRCLRQISTKSKGGRGLVAILRRLRARTAVRTLTQALELESC